MTTDTPPVLPRSLLDLIGEYGYARTAGLSEFERLDLWERLIVAIKEYATQHAATTERDLAECRAALAEQAVQQWEYKTLWIPRHVSSMAERLNAHGAEGWEFCGIDHDAMHVFKRALATKEPQS